MNNENNRPPIKKVHWFDGINPENEDFKADQDGTLQHTAYVVNDFHGSGILQKNPVTLPPILDTSKPFVTNISYTTINTGNFDGKGIFVDRQPVDTEFGDQLLISVENVDIPLYTPLKVIIFGKIYDPTTPQGIPVLETLVFDKITSKATYNYFKSVIAVFFNNFAGGTGRTDLSQLSQISLNTGLNGTKGIITIREVGPLQVLDGSVVAHQTNSPNLDVRDFITSTITRTFNDELIFVVNTAQNTGYVPVSLFDLNQLPLNSFGIANRPFLDSTTNGVIYGQKIFLTTNNIQQVSLTLSLDSGSTWSGQLVIGIRPLQTKSVNQFANKVDLDPDINILFEASYTQNDLLNIGYQLTTIPQEISFNFIGTAIAKPNSILTAEQYYVVTISRRADISTGKIFIDAGTKSLVGSKFTSFNPTTKAWTDDAEIDLWFKIHSAAVRVTSGIAYMTDGTMVSLQKTSLSKTGAVVSTIAGPFSLAVIDSIGSDNIVMLETTQEFIEPGEHPRTGNLVFLRIIDSATISILNVSDFNKLVAANNDANQANFPIVLAVVNDFNNKSNQQFNGVVTLPGQVRKNEIVLFNTGLPDALLEINNVIVPNAATSGIAYRIVKAKSTTQYLGDFNNDKLFTAYDLVKQLTVQDTFSAQSTNTFTGTAFNPYSIMDTRSRDALGFGKETVENFIISDVDGYLTINSIDVARLQYLTTTLPALVSPAPTVTTIQVLTLENITSKNTPILITQITDLDGYADGIFPDQLGFTALNVGDMRAISVNDTVDLSINGFATTAFSGLLIKKFIQRNDLIIETRFQSDVLPTVDTSYVLTFYNQNPVFNGQLGVFDEIATEILEFVAPGIDLIAANIVAGDIVQITDDAILGTSRNGVYIISQIINVTTFRVSAPILPITSGVANAGIEIFASDGITDKLNYTTVTGLDAVVQFSLNNVNLTTSAIQQGDKVHITLGPVAINGVYTVARVLSNTVFTVFPPVVPLIAQTFTATFEFRDSADLIDKIAPISINSVILGAGPSPYTVVNMETLAPASLPDGIDSIFTYSLTHVPITGTVSVHWTSGGISKAMLFSASPVEITGDGNPANSSINRITGTITIDTFQPADAGTAITTNYRIAPTVTLKHCYPTVINAVSPTQTDIEFKAPFINSNPTIDITGIATSSFVIIQTNNSDPPAMVLNSLGNVVAGTVQTNTINTLFSVIAPSKKVVLQLTDSLGNVPDITSGEYWMRIYSGTRVNVVAIQKEFLSDTISLSSPINWIIRKNNFNWLATDMNISDYRRFLPASFVSKISDTYNYKNEMWMPSDIFISNGELLSSPGVPYHGDIEVTKVNLDLPVTALLSNNINIYNNIIASFAPTPGFTRGGMLAMKFSDGSYVGADDNGNNTALSKNQVRIIPTIGSLYLDGYQVPNAPSYVDLDEVLTKLHYEIRMGTYFDDASGILYFHAENIKSIFDSEPIIQTGVVRIVVDVSLKKAGFNNPVISVNSTDILRLFTNPVDIIPVPRYSVSGEIVAGFTVGRSTNPDG